MYAGRVPIGGHVFFPCACRSGGALTDPSAAPQLTILDYSGSIAIEARTVPRIGTATGLFGFDEFVGSSYSAGFYHALLAWKIGGSQYGVLIPFEVLPSGDAKGCFTSLYFYDRPQAQYVVGNTESGVLEYHSNPGV